MTSKNRTETGVITNDTFKKIMKTFGDKKPKKSLKLYVWHGVLEDYTAGVMFALASSRKEAEKKIIKSACCNGIKETLMQEMERVKPVVYNRPVGFYHYGGS